MVAAARLRSLLYTIPLGRPDGSNMVNLKLNPFVSPNAERAESTAQSMTSVPPAPQTVRRSPVPLRLLYGAGAAVGVMLALTAAWFLYRGGDPPNSGDSAAAEAPAANIAEPGSLQFPKEKWAAAGLAVSPVKQADLAESEWVTGKIALNEDRLAHVYPLVEGVVREVRVQYGQSVRAGEVLATIDSKEVGSVKLDLVKNRLAVGFAQINEDWSRRVQQNTQALIDALEEETQVLEIEERFRDQPMGDYRQQLVTSYSHVQQTKADFDRVRGLYEQKIATERDYVKAKTDFESALATYQAHFETIKFAARQQLMAAEQKTKEAATAQSVSESSLLILGYSRQQIAGMDPIDEGETVAHYPIAAPLDGTIIKKDIVLLEHVAPDMLLFQIADMSSVWLRADVFEKDLPLLAGLEGEQLEFRSASYPGRQFTATVAYTGDLVEEATRAVRLIARADNAQRLLKPGMFVEVRLPRGADTGIVLVPSAALHEHAGESFVFIQRTNPAEFERRLVKRGREVDGQIEILDGLTPGERIVSQGGFALKSEMLRELMAED